MKKNLITSVLMTVVTTILFGLSFPLVITGLAQVLFPKQANGELITRNGRVVGSRLIGQSFSSPGYFHSRPSSAGTGYDASNSGGSNLGPTNQSLIARVQADADRLQKENPGTDSDGSADHVGFGPRSRHFPRSGGISGSAHRQRTWLREDVVREAVRQHTESRQFGFLGEPRVNVLELNLTLDEISPKPAVTH